MLRQFGQGIQHWIDQETNCDYRLLNITRIGRWSNFVQLPEHTVEFEYVESYRSCDLAVIFGSWKPREKGSHNTRNSVALNAEKFLVIETPLLNRKTAEENTQWRIGLNGYLNRDAEWPILTPKESADRLADLKIRFSGWRNDPDGAVLIALQLPGDASLRGTDINEWAYHTACTIRLRSKRPIIIRSHPFATHRAFSEHGELAYRLMSAGVKDIMFSDGGLVPWHQDLDRAWCTVTYSSGLAVDSVLAGVPTIACDEGNFAWGISSNNPEQIETPRMASQKEVSHWLKFLAGCQWSLDDMRDGVAWHHLHRLIMQK